METSDVRSIALDLGSTAIKGGLLDDAGRLTRIRSVPAPELRGQGELREADPRAYLGTANTLLKDLAASSPPGTPLGLTGQRSTFTLWNQRTGQVRIPLISWQDRRAAAWCETHRAIEPEVFRRAGLALSAHYAGPKLAAIQQQDPDLATQLQSGHLLFGNLDAYLIWNWTSGTIHETDLSMAARTSLVALQASEWSEDLLSRFDVPRRTLPRIEASGGRDTPLFEGHRLTASLADQASGALSVLEPAGRSALVNLGTGGFVLLPIDDPALRIPGFLTAPILGTAKGERRFALEGTITGAAAAVNRFGPGPTTLPETDPAPDAFAVPDAAGLGSPHWLPGFESTLSPSACSLVETDQRRVVLEGLLFRVREILEGLSGDHPPRRVLLSGGLANEPAVAAGLAALLERPVDLLEQRESTLLGVARLAAGLEPYAGAPSRSVDPGARGRYLRDKYERWRVWFRQRLDSGNPDT